MVRTLRRARKDIGILTGSGLSLSIGTSVIGRAGAAHGEEQGITNISQQMGLLGEIKGKGMLLGVLRESIPLYPAKGRRRKVI